MSRTTSAVLATPAAPDVGAGGELDVRGIVRRWLEENFVLGPRAPRVADEHSLVEAQLMDSTGVLELVAFLEQRFAIAIADEDIRADNLDTVAGIARLVGRLRQSG